MLNRLRLIFAMRLFKNFKNNLDGVSNINLYVERIGNKKLGMTPAGLRLCR